MEANHLGSSRLISGNLGSSRLISGNLGVSGASRAAVERVEAGDVCHRAADAAPPHLGQRVARGVRPSSAGRGVGSGVCGRGAACAGGVRRGLAGRCRGLSVAAALARRWLGCVGRVGRVAGERTSRATTLAASTALACVDERRRRGEDGACLPTQLASCDSFITD